MVSENVVDLFALENCVACYLTKLLLAIFFCFEKRSKNINVDINSFYFKEKCYCKYILC